MPDLCLQLVGAMQLQHFFRRHQRQRTWQCALNRVHVDVVFTQPLSDVPQFAHIKLFKRCLIFVYWVFNYNVLFEKWDSICLRRFLSLVKLLIQAIKESLAGDCADQCLLKLQLLAA